MRRFGPFLRSVFSYISQERLNSLLFPRSRVIRRMSKSAPRPELAFTQRVNPTTGQSEWVEQVEDYDYHQEIARSAYADMLHDHDRNMKYYKGLELAIKDFHRRNKEAIVLDIGTGTGLLSMMAAKLGANQIYACEAFNPMAECAGKVIRRNGYQDRITLIHKRSTDLEVGVGKDLPVRANILITEVFDTELIGEGAIGTFNHAHEQLLTDDCFVIPAKAILYAQVVDCPLVPSWNSLKPISLPNGVRVSFPPQIQACAGVPSVHDVQLSEIKADQFTALSEPLPVFVFDWEESSKRIPSFRSSSLQFISKSTKSGTAIFSWWDLQMSSLVPEEDLSSNTISMEPSWAGPNCVWRDHWMQSIYYVPRPLELAQGSEFSLRSCHDEFSLWFDLTASKPSQAKELNPEQEQRPICDCGVHIALSRPRIGMFNDAGRNAKFIKVLEPLIKAGETVALVLSEGSALPFIVAGLGAGRVIVVEPNGFSARAMKQLVEYNGFEDRITLLESMEQVSKQDVKIDLVVGDPFFQSSVLPWHNLHFWYGVQKLRPCLSPNVSIVPKGGRLRAVAVNYRDLWKIRAPVGRVCNGDFDLVDFDRLILGSSDRADSYVDDQPLWEYPAIAASEPLTLLAFDLGEEIRDSGSGASFPCTGLFNGLALWMDWDLTEGTRVTTGPLEEVRLAQPIQWDMYSKQGVCFFNSPSLAQGSVKSDTRFSAETGNVGFEFKLV